MHLYEFEGKRPTVHPEAFVAPTATLIGDVTVEKGASVWYGAVLRADICTIVIREGANVQDNSVLHAGPDQILDVGPGATVAHTCVVHHNDRPCPWGYRGLYQTLVEIECILSYVDEYGHATPQHKRVCRRCEGVGRHDDFVAGI